MQNAYFLRRIMLLSLACLAVPYFSTLSYKRHDFRKKKLFNIKCVFWFSVRRFSETCRILRRIQRDIINVHMSFVKWPLFLSDFSETWLFSTDFRTILNYQISWKSIQWEPSCSMRTDGQTDMTIVAFRNFTTAPQNGFLWVSSVGFWRWCKTLRNTLPLNFFHHPIYN